MSTQTQSFDKILNLVLYALPLAFGVVLIILYLLEILGVGDPLDGKTAFPLLAIGMLCLGFAGLNNLQD